MAKGQRGLGFWALLALVVGNMIGSGIYLLPASLAPLGWNQMIGWLVSITGAMALGFVFARLGARIPLSGGPYAYADAAFGPLSGGPYAYADAAFGPLAGFTTAWSYWVMSWVGNGAIAVAVVSALDHIFPRIGQTAGLPALLAVACVWLVTWVNIRGVRAAGRLQEVTVVLKLLPLVLLIGLAAWLWLSGAPRAPDPQVPITGNAVAGAVGLTFWGFLGLEAGTVPADKVDNPARNVPRATLIGVLLTGAIYLLISGAFALYVPIAAAAGSPAPVADFLGLHFGPALANLVALCAAISAFGTLNGWVLVQAEMPWAMARGGVFPAWFGVEGPRGTPVRSHLVSSSLLTAVTLLNYQKGTAELFAFIASVSLAAGLLTYLMSALAALRLQRQDGLLVVAAVIASGFTVWAEYGLGLEAIAWGTLLIVAGLPVFWAVRNAGSS